MRRQDALQVRLPAKTPRVSILSGHADTIHTDLGQATRLKSKKQGWGKVYSAQVSTVQGQGKGKQSSKVLEQV